MQIFGKRIGGGPKQPVQPSPPSFPPIGFWEKLQLQELALFETHQTDDPATLVPAEAEFLAIISSDRLASEAKAEELNSGILQRYPQRRFQLRPFYLVQDSIWNGGYSDFLMFELALNPYQQWNVVYLPTTDEASLMLNRPLHPARIFPPIEKLVQKLMPEVIGMFEQVVGQPPRQRPGEIRRFGAAHRRAVAQIKKIARFCENDLVAVYEHLRQQQAG